MKIIDAHAHLGDVLYPGGGRLIFAGRVRKRFGLDLITLSGWLGHRLTWYRDLKAAIVRKLLAAFGPERVVFASDWPFGDPGPMVRVVKTACRGDLALERMVFHDNAARLLGL